MADVKQIQRELKRLGGEATLASPRTLASSNAYSQPTTPTQLLGMEIRKLDPRGCFFLGKNPSHLREAEFLIYRNPSQRSRHLEWMRELHSLRLVELHGDVRPEFLNFLQVAEQLQHLTFYKSTITEEHLSVIQGLSHIQSIVFADCDLEPAAVVEARKHLPGVVLAYNYDADRVLKSQLPPMKLPRKANGDETTRALKRLHRAVDNLKLALPDRWFGKPITKDQRAKLEKTLGFVLPAEIAALMEHENGQPRLLPFLGPAGIVRWFHFQMDFGWTEFFWRNYRDTRGRYHRLLLPFSGADADTLYVNLLTGQVVETQETGGSVMAKSLEAFINAMAVEVEAGRIDRSHDWIRLSNTDLRDKSCPGFAG